MAFACRRVVWILVVLLMSSFVSPISGQGYSVVYSTSSDRTSPEPLQDVELFGDVYVFLDTSQGTRNDLISSVEFRVSGTDLYQRERRAPYDFQGGSSSTARPWNALSLSPNIFGYTMTVDIGFSDGTVQTLEASFQIGHTQVEEFTLQTSQDPSRFPSQPLQGSALSGNQYIFLHPETNNVQRVDFDLDNGLIVKSERRAPFDFRGGQAIAANAWNSDLYEPGSYHVIRTTITLFVGDPVVFDTFFYIDVGGGCSEISYLPCESVRVAGNYSIDFNSSVADTIVDQNGIGTGFVMVDPPTAAQAVGPFATVPGYSPSRLLIDVQTGTLSIQATSGLQFTSSNNLVNAMGVGLDLPSKLITVETVMAIPSEAVGGWTQAGLWFGAASNFGRGTAQDDYCKLILASEHGGDFLVQLQCEVNAAAGGPLRRNNVVSAPFPPTVTLRMEMNPVDKEVTGFAQFDNGLVKIGTLDNLPDEFFSFDQAGIDPLIKTRSMGGIFASTRNSGIPQTFVFHSFDVMEFPLPPPGDDDDDDDVPSPPGVLPFDRWSFSPEAGVGLPTSLAYGPDGRLYVLDIFGSISAVTLDYYLKTVIDQQEITAIQDNEGGEFRLALGLAIDPHSTPTNVVLWVGHSDGNVNAGGINTGKVTKISNYPHLNVTTDVIWDLPRAYANHALNNIEFGPDKKLYLAFGGSTGAGAPNTGVSEFRDRPEQPLSAALLVADVFDPKFGGSCGTPLYEFGIPTNCSVEVFSSGLRNSYDLTWHFNGQLYATDNGLGVTGTVPPDPSPPCTGLADLSLNPGKQPDVLQRLEQGSYYGHPNPYRDECVFKNGEFQSLYSGQTVEPLSNYKEPMFELGTSLSANGIIAYLSNKFFSKMMGDLLIVNYSSGDSMTRTVLSANGTKVTAHGTLLTNLRDPLPIEQDPEGRIYVGEFGGSIVTILDPQPLSPEPLGTWSSRNFAPLSVLDPASTTLHDKLYMIGGKTSDAGHISDAYVYDPFQDEWTQIASPPFENAVENAVAVSYQNKIYVFGGSTSAFSGAQNYAAYYDPESGNWTSVPDMPTARGGATAQVMDGQILVIGGMDGNGTSLSAVEIFDPETNTWSTGPSLQTRRDNPGSALLENGKVYIVGGRTREANGQQTTHATIEVLDSSASSWSYLTPMPTARRTMIVGTISGRLQVVGGESPVVAVNEEYNPETDTWRQLTPIEIGRHGAAGATIRGRIYVACGGPSAGSSYTDEVEVFAY